MGSYQYYKEKLKGIPMPYACLDLNLFRNNIEKNLKRAGNKKIRIASKSIRCIEAMHLILDYNEQFQGIMAYNGKEALFLVEKGFDDILLGYPVVDSKCIESLGHQISKGKYICLMVDSISHLMLINEVGKSLKLKFPVCLDIDLSDRFPALRFGVWRSSIHNIKDLEVLLSKLKTMDYIKLDGLMGYEAQIAGVIDNKTGSFLKDKLIRGLKRKSVSNIQKRREAAVGLIKSYGFQLRFVNGGGTGSLETTIRENVITEVTIGSGFYNPNLFDHYKNFKLEPTLFYAVPIVRIPKKGIYTCQGGGYIASGSIESSKAPIVHLPANGYLTKLEGAGEVQTPIIFKELKEPLGLGDPVFMRHAKSGELCERFNKLIFLDSSKITSVPTYRGENMNFG